MEKKVFLSVAAMSMLLATGCQNEVIVEQGASQEYALTLDMGAQSRTMHDADGNCVWGDNEQIYVVGEGGKVYGTLTMKSKSNGGRTAVFSGKVTGDPGKLQYMVYPVPEADGTIPMGNIDGTNHNAPMTGVISGGNVQNVDYAGGLVKVPVSGVDEMTVGATNEAGRLLTGGSYSFNPATGGLTFVEGSGSSVSISNVSETNGYVYVPVETDADADATNPDDQTESVTVQVVIGKGNNQQSQSFEAEVQEGAITTNGVPSFDVDEESGDITLSVTTAEQLRAALAAGGDVELAGNITIGNEAMTIAAKKVVNLNLNGFALTDGSIANNGTLTIKSETIAIENVSNFTLTGEGEVSVMGGVYSNNELELKEGYEFVSYNIVFVVLPNEGYTIVGTAAELNAAVAGGHTDLYLLRGEYDAYGCGGKTISITGNGDAILIVKKEGGEGADYSFDSNNGDGAAVVTFNHIVFSTNSNSYDGYARMNGVYNDCTFDGTYCLYGNSVFDGCQFNVVGDVYNLWTWGAPTATFTDCTFNCDGKAVLLYGTANTKLTMDECTFNDNGGLSDLKAAIEIGNDYNKSYELYVNNAAVNGFEINDKGINTGTTLWANKNSMGTDKLNVVIDGVDVY